MPAVSKAFDRVNNVEQVMWDTIPAGKVQVSVVAHAITAAPQKYALVIRLS